MPAHGASAGRTRRHRPVWLAFVVVHGWLTTVGVVIAPASSFYDVDLYRYWTGLALDHGTWPVLDEPWVYPAGALLPMLLPALGSTTSTVGYALGWCVMVTLLDAVAVAALLRLPGGRGAAGAWWWLAFLVLLGPVAMGRLDAVVAPLMLLSLLAAATGSGAAGGPRSAGTRLASALLTVGAWIKVAPGALLLPLAAATRRPLRDVVLPAAAVCAVVVATVAAGGGLPRVASFLLTQRGRGLQVESVTATPWVLVAGVHPRVDVALNDALVTYEVTGPGTAAAAAALDVVLVAAVAVVAAVLLAARRRGRAAQALLPGSLVLVLLLIVANKVGSPQFLTWLAAPTAVLVAVHRRDPGTRLASVVVLVAAGLTQVVFPWGYMRLLTGDPALTAVLALRNLALLVVLAVAAAALLRALRTAPPFAPPRGEQPPRARPRASGAGAGRRTHL